MKKYYKNKKDDKVIPAIQKIRDKAVVVSVSGGILIAAVGTVGMVVFVVGTTAYTLACGEVKTWEECNKCNMIVVNDGSVITFKEIDSPINPSSTEKKKFSKEYKVPFENYDNWQSYEVSSMDTNSCVIFVYADDENSRTDYTDFILSNIIIDQNKTLFFNEENITNENYESYLLEKEEAPQRKRV